MSAPRDETYTVDEILQALNRARRHYGVDDSDLVQHLQKAKHVVIDKDAFRRAFEACIPGGTPNYYRVLNAFFRYWHWKEDSENGEVRKP